MLSNSLFPILFNAELHKGDLAYVSTSPITPPTFVPSGYRTTNQWLFADVQLGTTTVPGSGSYNDVPARSGVTAPTTPYSLGSFGPTYTYVDKQSEWTWTNPGGDFINTLGQTQNTTNPHFTFSANSVTSGSSAYTTNITTGCQQAFSRGKWNAYIVKVVGGTRALAAMHNPTLPAPTVSVVYTDLSTATLKCVACVRLTNGTVYSQIGSQEAPINSAVALEFEMPTKAISSATLNITVTQHTATSTVINGYLANPPVTSSTVYTGIAQSYTMDENIISNPSVLFAQRYNDGSALSDWVIPTPAINVFDTNNWSPDLFGIGPADPAKLPTAHLGTPLQNKWFYKQITPNVSLVDSSYTGDGFQPLYPGLGALRIVTLGNSSPDGSAVGYAGSYGCDLWALFDVDVSGYDSISRTYTRFYVRIADGPDLLADTKMFRTANGSAAQYATRGGKWGPGVHQWTHFGGNNNVGGGNIGWTNRCSFLEQPADLPVAGFQPGVHSWDMIGYNMPWGNNGGLGASLYPDNWYCVEVDCQLNTFNPAGGSPADGVMTIYIDGQQTAQFTGWSYRDGPIDYLKTPPVNVATIQGCTTDTAGYSIGATSITIAPGGTGALPEGGIIQFRADPCPHYRIAVGGGLANVAAGGTVTIEGGLTEALPASANPIYRTSSGLAPFRDIGPIGLALNNYNGGVLPPDKDSVMFITGIVCATDYVGPMKPPTAPWAPLAGEIKNIGTNTLQSIDPSTNPAINPNWPAAAPWMPNGTSFIHTTDYCGATFMPDLGDNGTYMMYASAGHSAGGPVSWNAFDVTTLAWSTYGKNTLPVDNFWAARTDPYNVGAFYPPAQLDATWGEWQGNWVGWGALAQPGYNPPEGGHTWATLVTRPAAQAGNQTGEIICSWEPVGITAGTNIAGSFIYDADSSVQNFRRTANLRPSAGSTVGGKAYFDTLDIVVGLNFVSSAWATRVDVLNCATETWIPRTVGNAPNAIIYSTSFAWNDWYILVNHALSPTSPPFQMFAINAADLKAGTATNWTNALNLSATTYPVGADGTSIYVGFAYCPVNGTYYATNGVHGSTKLWKLTPPVSGVVTDQWVLTEQTMTTGSLDGRLANGLSGKSFVYNRLQWTSYGNGFLWHPDYTQGNTQIIRPTDV